MIPSARFGDIRVSDVYNEYVICDLYSLYEGGIEDVASNKEFCLFILVELHHKLSMHNRAIMSWNGETSREKAEELYHRPDETTHAFFDESRVLLRGSIKKQDSEEVEILPDEDTFRMLAEKVIKDFSISGIEPMEGTFSEFTELKFSVANTQLISHLAEGLLIEW